MDKKWSEEIGKIVRRNLPETDIKLFIFGSRATGTNRPFSDADLGILGSKKLNLHIIAKIKADLEESRIPFQVDVVDFRQVSEEFAREAQKQVVFL